MPAAVPAYSCSFPAATIQSSRGVAQCGWHGSSAVQAARQPGNFALKKMPKRYQSYTQIPLNRSIPDCFCWIFLVAQRLRL